MSVKDEDILAVLEEMGIEITGLTASCLLRENIGMDSQEIVELHCNLEDRFGIELPSNTVARSLSIGQLTELVQQFTGVLK